MKIVENKHIPKPLGHYSTAIVSNGQLYISGQLPISWDGAHHHNEPFNAQFEVVFQNIRAILETCGSSLDKVVKVTAYIVDIQRWPEFNTLYANFMGTHRPVRTVVPVPNLHYDYQLEVDLIAEV